MDLQAAVSIPRLCRASEASAEVCYIWVQSVQYIYASVNMHRESRLGEVVDTDENVFTLRKNSAGRVYIT